VQRGWGGAFLAPLKRLYQAENDWLGLSWRDDAARRRPRDRWRRHTRRVVRGATRLRLHSRDGPPSTRKEPAIYNLILGLAVAAASLTGVAAFSDRTPPNLTLPLTLVASLSVGLAIGLALARPALSKSAK
jgi:hypothetical protein